MKKIVTMIAAALLLGAAAAPETAFAAKKPAAAHAAAARAAPARRAAPRAAARPRAVARPAARRVAPRRAIRQAAPRRAAPSVNRAARQQRIQARQAAKPAAQSKTKLQAATRNATQSKAQTRAERRAARQQERKLRQTENREIRATPASQRAAKRAEIRKARQDRALNAQTNAKTQANTAAQTRAQRRAARLNGQARVSAQAAQQGRFAARANARANNRAARRAARIAARQAWRRGLRAAYVPWYGGVYWPYAYSDIFDYTFWPGGYDDYYWDYAYDDFFDGLFWGQSGPPADYAYAPDAGPAPAPRASANPSASTVAELCKQPGSGVTAWPFADISSKVGLNDEQKGLLDDMKSASQKAADVFKASCPAGASFPLTPTGRLEAMTVRLQATHEAVQTVMPALDKFYNSLSDEQKERFNELGPKNAAPKAQETTAQASADTQSTCGQPKPGLTNLPMERIEDAVNPNDKQQADLKRIEDATNDAVAKLQAACPDETPITPPGRLQAMDKRLQAMIAAADTVKEPLDGFYASLSNEQKARFNTIGKELANSSSND